MFPISFVKQTMKSNQSHIHGQADYIGIAGSILCIIHCLATPALALGSSLVPGHHYLIGGVLSMDYIFIAVNGIAVFMATKDHNWPWLRVFLWFSFALFASSLLLEDRAHVFEIASYVGSALLVVGHGYNLYRCRFSAN